MLLFTLCETLYRKFDVLKKAGDSMKKMYYGGKILTMQPESLKDYAAPEAVIIENGIISHVGTLSELKKYVDEETKLVNLDNKCLMPSFIDAHSHVTMDGRFSLFVNLSKASSFKDITDMLKEHIVEHNLGKDDVLVGFGYDNNFLKEKAQPDKRVLDTVSTQIPIVIVHVSAHLACANSKALEMAGITKDTPDPEGGLIERIEGTDEPSGYLEESGMMIVHEKVMAKVGSKESDIMEGVAKNYIAHGVTTMQDGATLSSDFELLKKMSDQNKLKVDIVAYPLMPDGGVDLLHNNREYCRKYKNHLKIGGYKLVLDGSPQGRTAWLTKPYRGGDFGYCGYQWMNDSDVEKYIRIAVDENQQLLTHCNGDAAGDQLLKNYTKVIRETGSEEDLRPVMIHCQTVRNDQLDLMAKLNMIASIFVGHVYYWGDVHVKNFGEERGNRISPVKDALDRGIHVTFHQDTPVTVPDMLHTVWCAVNRISRDGVVLGPEERIDVYDALKAVTIEAAYEYFEEDSKGTIEEGKRADLVILSDSPVEVDSMAIKDIKVMETIKDGETIYIR